VENFGGSPYGLCVRDAECNTGFGHRTTAAVMPFDD
jgi:hypothetical protein